MSSGGRPDWLQVVAMGLGGAALGSFAALVAARLPHQRSLWRPRSHCEACGAPIRWRHLVPLLSYLRLGGRCRACRAPIGLRAFTSELVMGLVAAALAARGGPLLPSACWLVVLTLTWAAALIDMDTWWVPDVLLLAAVPWALAAAPWERGALMVAAGLLPAGLLWAAGGLMCWLRRLEAVGLGDVKLVALLGLGLGLPGALATLSLAAAQGAAVGLVLRLGRGHPSAPPGPLPAALREDAAWQPPPHAVPFAPFLWLGCAQVSLFPAITALWAWAG